MIEALLRLPASKRQRLFEEAEDVVGLFPRSIEKDLWVCWTLRELFALPGWGPALTFKGGTSLAKAWKVIERFSEDVDIVISRTHLGFGGERLSQKQLANLRGACQSRIRGELLPALRARMVPELSGEVWSLELAGPDVDPDLQTILFRYPTAFDGPPGYVAPEVKIELGARSETEPAERPSMEPYLAAAFPDRFGPSAFALRTVAPRRTFWEKAMLLHEETYRPKEKPRKARLSRHYYDLWSLIEKGIAREAIADAGLFGRVAAHRQAFFRYGWMDYATLARGRLRVVPPEDQLDSWRRDYAAMSREMFFGAPPSWKDVLATVGRFESEFNGA